MTTAQAAPNGPRVFEPPCSVENPAELHSAHLPADQDHNKPFPAGAYHVPPNIYVPKAHAYRDGDSLDRPHLDGPLPDRCQFMFSDGRQCQMARSDIHPSLCVYHSEREEQLFGDPFAVSIIRGRTYDLPELFSAARDLSTAASVNRVLAQVFRLLAQRRISRQEAATFAHLAKLLLRTISLMAADSLVTPADAAEPAIPNQRSERGAQFASRPSLRETDPQFRPHDKPSVVAPDSPRNRVILSESALADESKDLSVPLSASADSSTPPLATSPDAPTQGVATSNSSKISPSAPPCNSPEISTYKNTKLQPIQNQHLQSRSEGEFCSSGRTANVFRRTT